MSAASRPTRSSYAPTPERLRLRWKLLLAAFCACGVLVIGRAFQLQGLQREKWRQAAEAQQRERTPLPPRRGAIYDRDGLPLALSHETYRLSVAPGELRDAGPAASALRRVLGLSRAEARRVTSRRRRWVVLAGSVTAEQREQLAQIRGLHFERRLERFYPQGGLARELIGVVSGDARPLGGVEQQLDAVLRGEPGYAVLRRDAHGQALPALSPPAVPPRDGADVVLTVDADLQEIADGALREAVRATGASGGDLLIGDPHTGEILAAVSHRRGATTMAAITEPYEPGSTLKPFAVAALLQRSRVRPTEVVSGEGGRWQIGRRVLSDVHPSEALTLFDALKVSSNIGIAKFAQRLTPAEQYETLRDFGFGTATGVEYPAESAGRLRRPTQWTAMSAVSMSIGYEVAVTPLQLMMAYGALANGGVLMEPRLVREVRGRDGRVLYRARPQPVRRVVSPQVARQLTEMLVAVVHEGTASQAQLASFAVAGKTGTSRRTGAGGRYESGSYTSSFVGFFPAPDPQLTLYVKLDQPQGAYYGGLTAAPVSRETLHAILAAHSAPLAGARLLATRLPDSLPLRPRARRAELPPQGDGPYVLRVDSPATTPTPRTVVPVPALDGLPLRDAARRLHALGLHVRLSGSGLVERTQPQPGARLRPGATVRVIGVRP